MEFLIILGKTALDKVGLKESKCSILPDDVYQENREKSREQLAKQSNIRC